MQTLNMEDLQQVSGGFNFGRSAASGTGRWVGRGAGAFAGGFTGMALGAIAGPGGMAVGGAVGARVGGYLGGKLGSLVARRSFGYYIIADQTPYPENIYGIRILYQQY